MSGPRSTSITLSITAGILILATTLGVSADEAWSVSRLAQGLALAAGVIIGMLGWPERITRRLVLGMQAPLWIVPVACEAYAQQAGRPLLILFLGIAFILVQWKFATITVGPTIRSPR